MAPGTAALCVGAMWAVWHFPLFLVHDWTNASPLVFLFIMTGFSLVMALGFNASGQSIIAAILMHCAFNVGAKQVGDFLKGTLLRGHLAQEWLFAVSFWLVGVVSLLVTHGSLGVRSTD